MGFGDQRYAQQFRDLITTIARRVVQEERPDLRLGKVYSFDPSTNSAMILFPGETVDNLVKVRVAKNMQPTRTMNSNFSTQGYDAEGDIVRIAGKPGSLFILDYFSGAPYTPSGGGGEAIPPGTVDDYFRGDKTWRPLNKAAVGLPNVDNTSDSAKPLSDAAVSALGGKANASEVVKLTGEQTVAGVKKMQDPVAVLPQAADPLATLLPNVPLIFARSNGLPYWRDKNNVVRPLITPREAVHNNPNFEDWSAPGPAMFPIDWTRFWMNTEVVTAADGDDKVSGAYSLKIIRPGAAPNNTNMTTGPAYTCNPGDQITFEFYARCSTSAGIMLVGLLTGPTAAGANHFGTGSIHATKTVNLTTSWTKYSFSWTVPQDHYFFRFTLSPYTLSSSDMTFWIDDTGSTVTTPQSFSVLEDWVPVVFQNSWGNYVDISGGGFSPTAYRRFGKQVFMRGLLRGGVVGSPAFTLPAGFRPATNLLLNGVLNSFTRPSGPASTGTAHTHTITMTDVACRINVMSSGDVYIHVPSGVTLNNGYFSLDGLMFFTD